MEKILMIADPGIDDSFAIIYALLHPQLDLVGIVCGFGNVNQADALRNSAYLLNLAGRDDIPLINGAEGPLSGLTPEFSYDIHGPEGMGHVRPQSNIASNVHPFNKIYELIDTYNQELTIVNLSRLTSLAFTFLLADSNIHKIKEIIVMGGAFHVPGNSTPLAEANIHGDPHAAKVVVKKGEKLTFLPLNVSNRAIIPNDIIQSLTIHSTTPFSSILEAMMNHYSKQYQGVLPGVNGAPLHDVIPLSFLTNKKDYQLIQRQVFVVPDGPSKGLTFADLRPVPAVVPQYPVHKIILDFNIQSYLSDFVKIMSHKGRLA